MSGADDKKGGKRGTPPKTRVYTTPGDSDRTLDTPAGVPLTDPQLAPLAERFVLLAELGRGGMGVVYKARDNVTDEVVALKVLRPEIANDPALIERFKNELRLSRKITHKNVCRIHDLHEFGAVAAITMEFVEGETLRSWLNKNESFSVRRGTRLAQQIISGLAEAHVQGVVHRDLKPENLMLDAAGNIKIMDFGIARSVNTDTTLTGGMIGTPAYMSPEQAEGKEVDHRTDIYSLGLILYEMFTGQRAVEGDTPVAVAFKQVHETPTSPREVDPDLPPRIERAVVDCLKKDPAQRPQSVGELQTVLADRSDLGFAAPRLAEPDPLPSVRLARWGKLDSVLMVTAVFSLIYIAAYLNYVVPAKSLRLEVDGLAARRVVEDLAQQLGRPIPSNLEARSQLHYRRSSYFWKIIPYLFSTSDELKRDEMVWPRLSEETGSVMDWHIQYRKASDNVRRFAQVDRNGNVFFLRMTAWIPGRYQPAAVEERRTIVERAATLTCGSIPSNARLDETSGGVQGASYTAAWRTYLQGPPLLRVEMLAEKVVEVDCNPPSRRNSRSLDQALGYRPFTGMTIALLLILLFVLGRSYRSPILWRRLPLAVALGMMFVWLAAPWFQSDPTRSELTPPISIPIFLVAAVAAIAIALMGTVAAERYLRRHLPEQIASWVLILRGNFVAPVVSLALLRGTFFGLMLVALQVGVAQFSLWFYANYDFDLPLGILSRLIPDIGPVVAAVVRSSPGFYIVSAALLGGIVGGLIFAGMLRGLFSRQWEQEFKLHRKGAVIIATAFVWLLSGQYLYMNMFLEFFAGPIIFFWVQAALLLLLVDRYDVLTVMVAISTAVMLTLALPLSELTKVSGNDGSFYVLTGWAVLVLLFALAALVPNIREALANFKTQLD